MSRVLALVGEAYGAGGGIAQYNRDLFDALSAGGEHELCILPRRGRTRTGRCSTVGPMA